MNVGYGPLQKTDAARCAELEMMLFEGDDPWPEISFVRELAAPHNRYVAARVDDKLVGYAGMSRLGFNILPGTHPICPVMLGDAALAAKFADAMLRHGVYVTGFSYPVVPQGRARIRTQISAAHSREELTMAIKQFAKVKQELGL